MARIKAKSKNEIAAQYNRIIAADRASGTPNPRRVRKAANIASRYMRNIDRFWGAPTNAYNYRMRDEMQISRSIYAKING